MISISVAVDKKAALLRGLDLGERVIVDVSPETIGADLWPSLIERLDVNVTPAKIGSSSRIKIAEATAEAVREALKAEVVADAERAEARRLETEKKRVESHAWYDKKIAELKGELETVRKAAEAQPTEKQIKIGNMGGDFKKFVGLSYQGYVRNLPTVGFFSGRYDKDAERESEILALKTEYEAILTASIKDISERNRIAIQQAIPALDIELAEIQRLEKEAEKAKAAALVTKRAARLDTGFWEHETVAYDSGRYGAPWCAKITGVQSGGKLNYAFGDSTARNGKPGLLRLACAPGEIIAWGQKDYRSPQGTAHYIFEMEADGAMVQITQTIAYRKLTEPKAAAPAADSDQRLTPAA